jgi:hypothetical protein
MSKTHMAAPSTLNALSTTSLVYRVAYQSSHARLRSLFQDRRSGIKPARAIGRFKPLRLRLNEW